MFVKILMAPIPALGSPKTLFPGAGRCVGTMFKLGIASIPYRNIPPCQRIEETFATISSQRIDDYCMPRFTRARGQESIEEAMDQKIVSGDAVERGATAPAPTAAVISPSTSPAGASTVTSPSTSPDGASASTGESAPTTP